MNGWQGYLFLVVYGVLAFVIVYGLIWMMSIAGYVQ